MSNRETNIETRYVLVQDIVHNSKHTRLFESAEIDDELMCIKIAFTFKILLGYALQAVWPHNKVHPSSPGLSLTVFFQCSLDLHRLNPYYEGCDRGRQLVKCELEHVFQYLFSLFGHQPVLLNFVVPAHDLTT